MNRLTKYTKSIKYSHIGAMLFMALLVFMLVPGISADSKAINDSFLYTIFIDGNSVGVVSDIEKADKLVMEARRRVARENDEDLVLINYKMVISATKAIIGSDDPDEQIIDNIYNLFLGNEQKTKEPVYEVKINEFTVNLRTTEEVLALLNAVKKQYDEENRFDVSIVLDPSRELNVLTTSIQDNKNVKEVEEKFELPMAGAYEKLEEIFKKAENQDIEGFEFGIKSLNFAENVEVVQAYADPENISSLDEAINMVTKEEEKSQVYVVESGDTLSVIAEKNGTTVDNLIAMNSGILTSASTMLRVGDELKVTNPQPELSVIRTEQVYYEENYSAETQYIDNDEWYTTDSKVLQNPVEGFRKVVADINYRNDAEESRDIVYEDVVIEAVAKIIERGTKSPPTYMKPISGGRLTSGFGKRKAPKKGASTYHKGIDWAVPTGTAVCASSGGTVEKAGWGSGYGYCVYIKHENGTVTRYGHLSKVLVKSGQYVKQGEKIALSGNTGVSTGPHLHFEILVNGSQVNPLNYLN